MHRKPLFFLLLFVSSLPVFASNNPADFPLRFGIFQSHSTRHYHGGMMDWADGDGRGNLFQNGNVTGLDFSYTDCPLPVTYNSGFETYPAKWKKPGTELTVLMGVIGKPGDNKTCNLKVQAKQFVYVRHNGVLGTEPADAYKKWMLIHQYDPEHGKDYPVATTPPTSTVPSANPLPTPELPATTAPRQ